MANMEVPGKSATNLEWCLSFPLWNHFAARFLAPENPQRHTFLYPHHWPFKENPRMKRLLVAAIGLGLVLGTVSFAQDSTDTTKKTKKTKKKKATKTDATK
jgi:hypothetical protein